ncbi:MAG: Ig-like domain-containing protein [archaeon]
MSRKVIILTLATFLLVIPFVLSFNATTTTYTIDAFHMGVATSNISDTLTYEFYSTTTSMQPSTNGTSTSYSFFVSWFPKATWYDSIPPNITLHSPANNAIVYVPTITVNFSAIDELSTISNCTLFIDNQTAFINTTIPENRSMQITGNITEGQHTWHIGCYDHLGLPQNTSSRYITADFSVAEEITGGGAGPSGGGVVPVDEEEEEVPEEQAPEAEEEEAVVDEEGGIEDLPDAGFDEGEDPVFGEDYEDILKEILGPEDIQDILDIIELEPDVEVSVEDGVITTQISVTGLYSLEIVKEKGKLPRFDIDFSGPGYSPVKLDKDFTKEIFKYFVNNYKRWGDVWDWLLLLLIIIASILLTYDHLEADRKEKIWQRYHDWRQR